VYGASRAFTGWRPRLMQPRCCAISVGQRAARSRQNSADAIAADVVSRIVQGLAREECLMPGHDTFGKETRRWITSSGITVLDDP